MLGQQSIDDVYDEYEEEPVDGEGLAIAAARKKLAKRA